MIPTPNPGVADIGGAFIDIVSLLGPNATPQNSPGVINGIARKQIMLADPLTGAVLDLQAGGGGGGAGALSALTGYAADTNTPALVAGVKPTGQFLDFVVTTPGITLLGTPLSPTITSVRNGDMISWSDAFAAFLRFASDAPGPIAVAAPLTLLDAHNGITFTLTATKVLTINDGYSANYGNLIIGPFTTAGTATVVDKRNAGTKIPANDCFCSLVQYSQGDGISTHDVYWLKGDLT